MGMQPHKMTPIPPPSFYQTPANVPVISVPAEQESKVTMLPLDVKRNVTLEEESDGVA